MALIPCPDCGQMVSENAKSCIHCGSPLTANVKLEKVKLKRTKKLAAALAPFEIYVDGVMVANLANGKEAEVFLPSGLRTFEFVSAVQMGMGQSKNAFGFGDKRTSTMYQVSNKSSKQVEIKKDCVTTIELSADFWNGGLKVESVTYDN